MPYTNRAEIGLRTEIAGLIESDVANDEIGAALLAWGLLGHLRDRRPRGSGRRARRTDASCGSHARQ